jgi:hypothetical protein
MKYVAIHDERGTIHSLISGPDDGPTPVVGLEPGQRASEVDIPDSELDLDSLESEESAVKALASFRVDVEHRARLVRRGDDRDDSAKS